MVRRSFEEIWNQGNLAVIDELFDENAVNYNPPGPPFQGSTLIRKPSPQLSSQRSVFHLIRQPAYASSLRAFQIFLDDKKVSVIRQKESSTFEVQPGLHSLFLRIDWVSSPRLTFDIAPGEEVTFLCKGESMGILLWKQ